MRQWLRKKKKKKRKNKKRSQLMSHLLSTFLGYAMYAMAVVLGFPLIMCIWLCAGVGEAISLMNERAWTKYAD